MLFCGSMGSRSQRSLMYFSTAEVVNFSMQKMSVLSNVIMDIDEIPNYHNICRTCLAECDDADMVSLYSADEKGQFPRYDEMLKSCTVIEIDEDDGLPSRLCSECANQISSAYTYLQLCERTDSVLRQHAGKYLIRNLKRKPTQTKLETDQNNIKTEKDIKSETDSSDDDTSNSDSCSDNTQQDAVSRRSNRRTRPKVLFKPKVFPCKKCDKYFLSWIDLSRHNLDHPKNDKICCRFCHKEFIHARHIPPHIVKEHSSEIRYRCGYCDVGDFHNDAQLCHHMSQHRQSQPEETQDTKDCLVLVQQSEVAEPKCEEKLLSQENDKVFEYVENIEDTNDKNLSTTKSNKCNECNHTFQCLQSLEDHLKHQHPYLESSAQESAVEIETELNTDVQSEDNEGIRNEMCDVCSKSFRTASDLRRHIITHDPDKPFHCPKESCKWSFPSERDLLVHINVNHTEGKNECQFCQKVFKHPRNLRQHMITHKQEKRFTCKYCNKGFNHLHHLTNHERTHTKDTPYLCNECGRSFGTKDRLTFHIRLHNGERPFKCTHCEKSFVISAALNNHLRTHTGDRPFMCSHCGKTFTAKFNLNKHMRALHNVQTALNGTDGLEGSVNLYHTCGVCGHTLTDGPALSEHMKEHTCRFFCDICNKGFSLTSALESHSKTHEAGDRSHVCSVCNAGFNRPEHLKSHIMRRHTGEKPFKCSVCSRCFIQSGELNIHMRRHTGERPYVCAVCNRAFIQSNALTSHMRTHTGERPYICAVCNKGHCTSGGLSQHMRTHNKLISTLCIPADPQLKTSTTKEMQGDGNNIGNII